MTTQYDLSTKRRSLKVEKAEYVQAAVDFAYNSPAPTYEGSRTPTRSVLFTIRTPYEGMIKWAQLSAGGWELDINFRYNMIKLGDKAPHQFAALAPKAYFDEHLLPVIMMSAEQAYEREIEEHNKQVQKGKVDQLHREALRAKLRADKEAAEEAELDRLMRNDRVSLDYETMMSSGFTNV